MTGARHSQSRLPEVGHSAAWEIDQAKSRTRRESERGVVLVAVSSDAPIPVSDGRLLEGPWRNLAKVVPKMLAKAEQRK